MKAVLDNDKFIEANFEELVQRFPRQHIVVSKGEVFTGENAMKKARAKYPKTTPLVMPIPAPEEFNHLL